MSGVQAESEQAVGVATNTPRRVGRCEVAEEMSGAGVSVAGASSMSGWQNAQQKRQMRLAFKLLTQQVLDAMTDLAHASSSMSRRIHH